MPLGLTQLLYRLRDRRGVALIAVLWILTALALLAASFMRTTRSEINLAHNLSKNAKAEALADAGVYRSLFEIIQAREGQRLSSELERILENRPGLESAVLKPAQKTGTQTPNEKSTTELPLDGTPLEWRFGGGRVTISIQDETAKIDLNFAAPDLLRSLFMAVGAEEGVATSLADAIVDFRDPDDVRQLHGAEDTDYAAAGLDWDAKDAPFTVVDELQQVLGMTTDLYRAVLPAVTVYANRPRITEANAPPLVRAALLGLVDPEAARAMAAEENAVGTGGTSDELADAQLPDAVRARMQQGGTTRTDIVSIRSEAVTKTGAHFVRQAVVRVFLRGTEPFRIEDWRQGHREAEPAEDSPAVPVD